MSRPLAIAFACSLASAAHAGDAPKLDPFAFPHGVPTPAPRPKGYAGLGAESISPEDIARFAPQALDPKVSRHIQAMLDARGVGGGIVTNSGARMYFNWKVTGTTQVWRQDGALTFPIQLTGGEDNTSVVGLAPDESFLVVSRDVGGSENPGLYVMSPDGGPLRVIQHTPNVQTQLELIADDSSALFYRANDIDPGSYAIYRWDLKAARRELVFDTPGLWSVVDHRSGQWLMVKELGNAQVEVYTFDTATKQLTPLLGQHEAEDYEVAFGPKPGQVLVRTNKLGDFQRLYSLEAGKLVAITPAIEHDVSSFAIDEPRTRIYYTVDEGGYLRSYAIDAKTTKPVALPKLPAADLVTLAGVSRNGRFVQLATSSATVVPATAVFDWQTRKLQAWRVPVAPELDPSQFAPVTRESFPARDGTQVPMFVRRPRQCGPLTTGGPATSTSPPCPVIVDFHGGPESQAMAGFSAYAQLFVDAGYVFVQPNVRGSAGYGKAWLHADDGPKRLDVITDIEDCAIYIRKAWQTTREPKIGVTGGSYGGYSTLMAMTYFAGAYDAGVEEVGISNLVTFLMNTAPYRRILRISEYGDPVKDHDALVKLSPITHVAKLVAPLLLIQGVNDPRVPVGEALQIYQELADRNVPTGLVLFADEGHGPSKRGNVVLAIGHTIAFFDRYLKE